MPNAQQSPVGKLRDARLVFRAQQALDRVESRDLNIIGAEIPSVAHCADEEARVRQCDAIRHESGDDVKHWPENPAPLCLPQTLPDLLLGRHRTRC